MPEPDKFSPDKDELGTMDRIESRILARFTILGAVIAFLFAIIVSLVGYVGTLKIENALAEARADLKSAQIAQETALSNLNQTLELAREIEQTLLFAKQESQRVGVQVTSISDRIEEVYGGNISISEDILRSIEELKEVVKSSTDAPAANLDETISNIRTDIDRARLAARKLQNSRYQIGIVSFGLEPQILKDTKELLFDRLGYSNRYVGRESVILEEEKGWFSRVPAVLYYSAESRRIADEIRRELSSEIGVEFRLDQGAGYGISEGEKETTLIVHMR